MASATGHCFAIHEPPLQSNDAVPKISQLRKSLLGDVNVGAAAVSTAPAFVGVVVARVVAGAGVGNGHKDRSLGVLAGILAVKGLSEPIFEISILAAKLDAFTTASSEHWVCVRECADVFASPHLVPAEMAVSCP